MRMHLECYWQGNTEQSLHCRRIWGFLVVHKEVVWVQRGLSILSPAAPNPAGRVERVPLKGTAMMRSPPTSQNTVVPGEAALEPGAHTTGLPLCTRAKGASPHRQISKCFDSATLENLLHAQLFTKKKTKKQPKPNKTTTKTKKPKTNKNPKPTTIWETHSSCTGCQISLIGLNQPFWVACLVWLYVVY